MIHVCTYLCMCIRVEDGGGPGVCLFFVRMHRCVFVYVCVHVSVCECANISEKRKNETKINKESECSVPTEGVEPTTPHAKRVC